MSNNYRIYVYDNYIQLFYLSVYFLTTYVLCVRVFCYVYIIKITCQLETEIINIVEIIKKNKQMREVKSFIDLMKSFYDE